jgi:hypothetical protein
MIRLLTRFVMLPLDLFVTTVDSIAKAMWEFRSNFGKSVDSIAKDFEQLIDNEAPHPPPIPIGGGAPTKQVDVVPASDVTGAPREEGELTMRYDRYECEQDDPCQNGEIRIAMFWVHFTMRDYETVLEFGADSVPAGKSLDDFKCDKKMEFLEQLQRFPLPVPRRWIKNGRGDDYPPPEFLTSSDSDGPCFNGFPESDREDYLSVGANVIDSYARKCDESDRDQARALEGIRAILQQNLRPGALPAPPERGGEAVETPPEIPRQPPPRPGSRRRR